jgi:hypothetical protein
VKLRLHRVLTCLLLAAAALKAQEPAPAQAPAPESAPAAQQPSAATLRAPLEVPSTVNTGQGLSFEPIYWMPRARPVLRGGAANVQVDPGNFDYTSNPDRAIGGRISVPIGKNASLRVSYFQTQSTGFGVAPRDLNLFGTIITNGDLVATRYRVEDFKASYDYLTYFWKRGNAEIRLKTLWEVQRISVTNELDEFVLNTDGSYSLNPATGSRSLLYPTFGLGIEHTMSKHFRWEARGSGFGLPHRGDLADAEITAAYRVGHFEVLGGGRLLHFKTTTKSDQYNAGTLYGPYVSVRYYWKKQ